MSTVVTTALCAAGLFIWYLWGAFPAIAYACCAVTVFGAINTKTK